MHDHNLDDLIIDHIEPNRKSSIKGFLTIIALAIVVMIVAIILTKIILKEPDNDQVLFEQNESEMISPDLTLQSITEPKEVMPEPAKEVISEEPESKPSQTPSVEESVKENLFEDVTATPKTEEKETPAQVPVEEPLPTAVPEKSTVSGESSETQTPAPQTPEPTVQEVVQPKAQPVPQKTIEETVKRPESRPANVLTRPEEAAGTKTYGGIYYIQVGSFSNTPSQSFLARIKNSGFSYTIIQSGGSSKLLIGPYNDRASAERALMQVRDRINRNAFIYTKK